MAHNSLSLTHDVIAIDKSHLMRYLEKRKFYKLEGLIWVVLDVLTKKLPQIISRIQPISCHKVLENLQDAIGCVHSFRPLLAMLGASAVELTISASSNFLLKGQNEISA